MQFHKKWKRWSRKEIIDEIIDLYTSGEDISRSSIIKNHRNFYQVIIKKFIDWEQLLEEAGFSSEDIKSILKKRSGPEKRRNLIDRIREAQAEGVDLRTGPVQKVRRSLYKSAVNEFGTWKKALSKAGVKYKELQNKVKEEKRKKLLCNLKKAYLSGVKLDSESIKRDPKHKTLYWSAKNYYKGRTFWEDTLTDAGIDYRKVVVQERWDEKKIKKVLFKLRREGKEINAVSLKNDDEGRKLIRAILKHFPSYEEALKHFNLNPEKIIKQKRPYALDEIVEGIITYSIKGIDLRSSSILSRKNKDKRLRRLFYAACRKFGGWRNSLQISGIDASNYIERKRWNKEKIKKKINELNDLDKGLNGSYIDKNHRDLYAAASRYFGSWEKALESCGFDYNKIRLVNCSLNQEQIISEIRRLASEGKHLDTISMVEDRDPSVRSIFGQASRKFTGGWGEAIQRAGFDYDKIRLNRRQYTEEELIEKIKELERKGVSLKSTDIIHDQENKKYYRAIVRRYRTWENFLNRVGIDSSKYIERRFWDNGKRVLEYLKDMFPSGIVTGVKTKDNNLYEAARRHFGGIEKATKTAGLVYSLSGKISKEKLEKNPEILTILYEKNKDFLTWIARKVYYRARSMRARTLEIDDLSSEAFIIFSKKIPQKPPKVDLRRYTYKSIYWGLININNSLFKGEVLYNDLVERYDKEEELVDILLYNLSAKNPEQ